MLCFNLSMVSILKYALRGAVGLSLLGNVIALGVISSLIADQCEFSPASCDGSVPLPTLSSMARREPQKSRFMVGVSLGILLPLPNDVWVCVIVAVRSELVLVRVLTLFLAVFALPVAIIGLVSATADPASRLHFEVGILYMSLRIFFTIAQSLAAFPPSHRPNFWRSVEQIFAWMRLALCACVCGTTIGIIFTAPSGGGVDGRLQLGAAVLLSLHSISTFDMLLLEIDATAVHPLNSHAVEVDEV